MSPTLPTANDKPPVCRWCGRYHGQLCPEVKVIQYHPDGSVKRVEFKTAADYPTARMADFKFGQGQLQFVPWMVPD